MDAWKRAGSLGSPTAVVAVIDDGFDLTHPDLSGEGKIVAPRDFGRGGYQPLPNPQTKDWHGTACAGVAVGNANASGIVGAAPGCRWMPIRWSRTLVDSNVEAWFDWATAQGAWVVSCSWGAEARNFPLSTRISRAITRCAQEGRNGLGCVVCFAAGNSDSDINDPASDSVNGFAIHPDVIAVAACTSSDERSPYSNYGAAISVCAPSGGGAGSWLITTSDVAGGFFQEGQWLEAGYSPGPYTDLFSGTSSACPLVAGVCALLLSVRPDLPAAKVKAYLQETARKISDRSSYVDGHSLYYGHGCVDADAAVRAALHG